MEIIFSYGAKLCCPYLTLVPKSCCGWASNDNSSHFSFSELLILQCLPILVWTQVLSKGLLLTMVIINDCVSRLPSTSCHLRACLLYCRLWEAVFVFMFSLMQCQTIHSVQQTIKVGEISLTVILLQILSLFNSIFRGANEYISYALLRVNIYLCKAEV